MLTNTQCFRKFYYLANITERLNQLLNQLNVKMHGIGNTIFSKQCLHLNTSWNSLLWMMNWFHFNRSKEFKDTCTANIFSSKSKFYKIFIFSSKLVSHLIFCSHSKHALENFVRALVFLSSLLVHISVLWTKSI